MSAVGRSLCERIQQTETHLLESTTSNFVRTNRLRKNAVLPYDNKLGRIAYSPFDIQKKKEEGVGHCVVTNRHEIAWSIGRM